MVYHYHQIRISVSQGHRGNESRAHVEEGMTEMASMRDISLRDSEPLQDPLSGGAVCSHGFDSFLTGSMESPSTANVNAPNVNIERTRDKNHPASILQPLNLQSSPRFTTTRPQLTTLPILRSSLPIMSQLSTMDDMAPTQQIEIPPELTVSSQEVKSFSQLLPVMSSDVFPQDQPSQSPDVIIQPHPPTQVTSFRSLALSSNHSLNNSLMVSNKS